MPFRQPTPSASLGESPVILRPDPRWFLTRGVVLGLVFPLLLRALGAGSFGLSCAIAAVMRWLVFKSSYIALDSQGFKYNSGMRRIAHAWVDIERFAVVEQRMLAFITVCRYLGWNYPLPTRTTSTSRFRGPLHDGQEQRMRCLSQSASTCPHSSQS